MSRQIKANYEQQLLLPQSLEDWVPAEHPARFIREFVDSLDLKGLGFKVEDNIEGRAYYSSELLLKVWLFGYYQRVRTTRQLEKQCKDNMSLIWLTGMNYPDHNTLWRFWNNNRKSIKSVFRESVLLASKLDMVSMIINAVDGTKIKAYASKEGALNRKKLEVLQKQIDLSIEEMEKEIESKEKEEEGSYSLPEELQDRKKLKEKIQEALKEMKEINRDNMNPDEKEARIMRSEGKMTLCYNAQAVVDEKNRIVLAVEVVNDENDRQMLMPMIEKVEETVLRKAGVTIADSGYATAEQIQTARKKDNKILLNLSRKSTIPQGPRKEEKYHNSNFRYDEETDVMICPESKEMRYARTKKSQNKRYELRVYRSPDCQCCRVREQCTTSKTGRSVKLNPYYKDIMYQQELQQIEENKILLSKRKAMIESHFGNAKHNHGFRRFQTKGLEKVRQEWSMLNTVINLSKIFKVWATGKIKLA